MRSLLLMNWRNRKLVSEIKTGNNDQLVLRLIQSVRKAMVTAFLEKNDSYNYPKNLSAILYFTGHIGQFQSKHLKYQSGLASLYKEGARFKSLFVGHPTQHVNRYRQHWWTALENPTLWDKT